MSENKVRMDVRSELMYFLEYRGIDKVLATIYELARDLNKLDESFSSTTALRKLVEVKEAYIRSVEISKVKQDLSDNQGVFWVRTYDPQSQNIEDPVIQETDTYDGCPDCKGSGFIGDPANRCIECDGTGEANTK